MKKTTKKNQKTKLVKKIRPDVPVEQHLMIKHEVALAKDETDLFSEFLKNLRNVREEKSMRRINSGYFAKEERALKRISVMEKQLEGDTAEFAKVVFADHEAYVKKLKTALKIIAEWKLPKTGSTWPDGSEMSYETEYGSNGVRDYIRNLAAEALRL